VLEVAVGRIRQQRNLGVGGTDVHFIRFPAEKPRTISKDA
jgi:hypothetical protein